MQIQDTIKCDRQVAILMATYNGEKYLAEQMDSLLSQTFQDFCIYVHDDGSKDGTMDILREYQQNHPEQVTVLGYPSQGGACMNFFSLLDRVEAPYYMFCDQDDAWLPDKIEQTMNRMRVVESKNAGKPVLVHTDLFVADSSLRVTAESFVRNQKIRIERIRSFADYAPTNTVTGCTMIINRQAAACVRRPYTHAMMHDSWICLSVVANGGIVEFIDRPTIYYRQHDGNVLGARDVNGFTLFRKLKDIRRILSANIAHYREMNAVKRITVLDFLKAKKHYKKA